MKKNSLSLPAFLRISNFANEPGNSSCGIYTLFLQGNLSTTVLEQKVDYTIFMYTLEHENFPHMSPYPLPQGILILDNVPTHNHEAVNAACVRFGVRCVFLPPYSYDFNPIE